MLANLKAFVSCRFDWGVTVSHQLRPGLAPRISQFQHHLQVGLQKDLLFRSLHIKSHTRMWNQLGGVKAVAGKSVYSFVLIRSHFDTTVHKNFYKVFVDRCFSPISSTPTIRHKCYFRYEITGCFKDALRALAKCSPSLPSSLRGCSAGDFGHQQQLHECREGRGNDGSGESRVLFRRSLECLLCGERKGA